MLTVDKMSEHFSVSTIEKWKDELAAWWGEEHKRYDQKRMVKIMQAWFGCSKKKAIQLEFNSRDKPDQWPEFLLKHVIGQFEAKLRAGKKIAKKDIALSCQLGAYAETTFKGNTTAYDVPGHIGLVGTVTYRDGRTQSIFQRFISHPFWQHSHRTGNP
jgi:hypothetical protein